VEGEPARTSLTRPAVSVTAWKAVSLADAF
jgi:hypothetical protein